MKYIKECFLEETNQLFLFIPVLIGSGAYIYLKYFFNNFSPLPYAGVLLFSGLSLLFRKKSYINLINIAILCFLLGMSSALFETKQNDFSMLKGENIKHYVEGTVSKLITKDNGFTTIIKLDHNSLNDIDNSRLNNISKVSIKLTKNSETPRVGDKIYLKAILNSPTPSVMKGAYDFRKDAYFKQIGAFGYAVTKTYFLSKNETISIFEKISNKVKINIENISSDKNSEKLVKALMLGQKKAIPKEITQDFRSSGIAHLLSISGLHIGLMFGFIFLLIRYLLALNSHLTLRIDIKKISAFIAITITLLYVILIGYPIPAVRAFIMTFIVFLGILFNRKAISMRNVSIAGILILLISPHSILSASFQMSFAAVVALVAAYELISDRNISLHGFKGYFSGIMFTSLIAIIATTPFAIYNFQNFSPYGILTNAIVMPIVSFITMPFIVLSYILTPIGLSKLPLIVVNISCDWIINTASYIANLKYDSLLIPPAPMISMTFFVFGGLLLCLFKHKLRFTGIALLTLSIIFNFTARDKPDIITSPNAKIIAVRNQEGLLTFSNIEKETFTSNIMRKINGQKELLTFDDNNFIKCNEASCIYKKDNREIDLNSLVGKPYTQQLYIKNGKINNINLK